MANNQSWEFYQQPDTGTKYPLQWVAGVVGPIVAPYPPKTLPKDQMLLVPFNQMRAATLSKIGINLTTKGGAEPRYAWESTPTTQATTTIRRRSSRMLANWTSGRRARLAQDS
jgi:hypothetical protein